MHSESGEREWLESQTPTIGDHVYHYTSMMSLRPILDDMTLRLSPLSRTNDPCEFNEWYATLFFSSLHDGPLEVASDVLDQALEDIDRLLRRNVCVGCFTQDRLPRQEAPQDALFHMGWARARMWDQYGDKHRGAVLAFDPVLLCESVEQECARLGINCERSQGEVFYFDQPRNLGVAMDAIWRDGVDAVVEGMRTAHHKPDSLYYRKNYDWASEEEYRITVVRSNPLPEELDTPLLIPIKEALQAIVLGEQLHDPDESRISERGAELNVPVFKNLWIDGVPIIEPL
jgi:hypothetical protein